MLTITPSSSSNKMGPAFLATATRNYMSARLLFLNNQLFDGGIMAHEATEKVMKATLYLKDPARTEVRGHVLNKLKPLVESELDLDLSDYEQLFEYYEVCYDYRYPDDPKPTSFTTGTKYVKLLDRIFIKLHNECLKLIEDEEMKNRSGIFDQCVDYFTEKSDHRVSLLLEMNDEIEKAQIDQIKNYWHDKGYYKRNDKGVTHFPGGMATKDH